jgi:hypothetical protein
MKLSTILEHHENTKLNSTQVGRLFLSNFYTKDEAEVFGEKTGAELRVELHRLFTPSKIDRHDIDIDKDVLKLIEDTSC